MSPGGGWRRAWEATRACPQCGGENTDIIEGYFPTGVVAPDGTEERRMQRAIVCLDCGEREEF